MRHGRVWKITDHLCRHCGGRILRCVAGGGYTPGGNPVFKCADCGKGHTAMGPECLCWCGFAHRRNEDGAYMCVSFSVLDEHPELAEAFRSCGCEPGNGEVGIMLARNFHSALSYNA